MFVGKSFWGKWNDLLTNFIIILTREFAMRPWRSLVCENRSQPRKRFQFSCVKSAKIVTKFINSDIILTSFLHRVVFSHDPNNFAANNSLNSPIFFTFFLL